MTVGKWRRALSPPRWRCSIDYDPGGCQHAPDGHSPQQLADGATVSHCADVAGEVRVAHGVAMSTTGGIG